MQPLDPVEDVKNWIREFVIQPHIRLAGWPPCPYARKALLEHKIRFVVKADQALEDLVFTELKEFRAQGKEVTVVIDPRPHNTRVGDLNLAITRWRRSAAELGLYVMRDHPLDREEVNGVCMNHGHFLLVFIQDLNALTKATRELESQGYYHPWGLPAHREMVAGREARIQESV